MKWGEANAADWWCLTIPNQVGLGQKVGNIRLTKQRLDKQQFTQV